jgi:hypothetical protein
MPRRRASSTPSRPNLSIIVSRRPEPRPSATYLLSSKASTIESDFIPRSATSPRSRWSQGPLKPVHKFGGGSPCLVGEGQRAGRIGRRRHPPVVPATEDGGIGLAVTSDTPTVDKPRPSACEPRPTSLPNAVRAGRMAAGRRHRANSLAEDAEARQHSCQIGAHLVNAG